MELYRDILKKCLSRRNVLQIQHKITQMALDILLPETNAGQKSLSSLGPKIWSKINPINNNAKTSSYFMYALKKKYFTSSANIANSNNYHILTIDIII